MAEAANQRPRQSVAAWLAISGGVLIGVGLIVGIAAKRSADLASYVASQPTRLVGPTIISSTRLGGLGFDPTSAHYTPPNYTLLWIALAVVLVGVAAVAGGIARARVRTA